MEITNELLFCIRLVFILNSFFCSFVFSRTIRALREYRSLFVFDTLAFGEDGIEQFELQYEEFARFSLNSLWQQWVMTVCVHSTIVSSN